MIPLSSTGGNNPGANPLSSSGVKLVGFVLLLVVIFVAAHAAGAHVGPVTSSYTPSQGGSGSTNMGGMP